MKRTLRAYMEFRIATNQDEQELIPSVGGYAVLVDGKLLQFDFADMSGSAKREGDVVKFSTVQKNLDFEVYCSNWIEEGLISENTSNEDIEGILFDYIKESTEVDEIYLDIFTGEDDNYFEGEILITSFTVVDIINNEAINILDKKINEGALFDNIDTCNTVSKAAV